MSSSVDLLQGTLDLLVLRTGTRVNPGDVVIEFDARSLRPEGDQKCELFGANDLPLQKRQTFAALQYASIG